MDQKDLQAIGGLIKKNLKIELKNELNPIKETLDLHSKKFKAIEAKLDRNTESVMKIEQKIDAALELRQDISEIRTTVKSHEERLSKLETL